MKSLIKSHSITSLIYFGIIILVGLSCNNCPNDIVSKKINLDPESQLIEEEINELESVLRKRGASFKSDFDSLSIIEKLKYLTKEVNKYYLITSRFSNSKPKSAIVNKDSLYEGCMLFSVYNVFSTNKLVLTYNNKTQEIPMSEDKFECRYKLKPYKLGENICTGYMIQGRDTYPFENRFIAIK